MNEQWRKHITTEPGKRGGRPCIRGMRITVYDVLSYLAAGMTTDEILDDFPYLTAEDIQACLAFAAEGARLMRVTAPWSCKTDRAHERSRYPDLAMRLTSIILGLPFLAGCGSGGASSTQSRLESAVASGAPSFDFAADPTFAWDRVYVFGCYSSQASVEKVLGFKWPDFHKTTIESSESVVLVIFVRNAQVVGWYEQPRSIELGWLVNDKGYSRSEAHFKIERGGGRVELKGSDKTSTRSLGRNR